GNNDRDPGGPGFPQGPGPAGGREDPYRPELRKDGNADIRAASGRAHQGGRHLGADRPGDEQPRPRLAGAEREALMFGPDLRCLVVVGAQWGDEGKGKLVDVLAEGADLVVRYQGGANAGHTVVIGDASFILHQIPSGILHQGTACVVGNGVVLDPETLFTELDGLHDRGVETAGRLFISDRAHLVMPYHKLLDAASERSQNIGTTGRGIGPTYEDKYGRRGIRVGDLRNLSCTRNLLKERVERANLL